ncbi:D-alanine--D-alanine ligase Ddl [Phycisphaerae bacterium RAS1]|nr:D-alanine--D-alanine ligase Ddl [Phycisphaerae bacterium RAS1]
MHTTADRTARISTPADRKLKITVLRGGPSAEREVSLVSGAAIAEALRRRGHDVFESDIGPDNLAALERAADVVFPALHGTFGEDGQAQRIMESRGIRFVGSGAAASAMAMDKVATKQVAVAAGIRTPAYGAVNSVAAGPRAGRREPEASRSDHGRHGGRPLPHFASPPVPVVVKPADQGSSVKTFIIRDEGGVEPAVRDVLSSFSRALVEQFIEGDELTVGILGDQALPPICIRPRQGFYDYAAKYQADDTEYVFESHPAAILRQAQEWSLLLHQRLGCRHLSRVDWICDRDGKLWMLEINTLPGFTSHSLVPKAAARVGVAFDELCERLVLMALEGD